MKEIERKWLLTKVLPSYIKGMAVTLIEQSYLSLDPEVRVRMKYKLFSPPSYVMTIKNGDGMVRDEDEIDLTEDQYRQLRKAIGKDPIRKEYYKYEIDGTDLTLEVSIVDSGTDNTFYYAEVEFRSAREADAFELPDWFVEETGAVEVTYDPEWKMKNYWKRTRLGNK